MKQEPFYISVSKGQGYYNLKNYPWGGKFERFNRDYENVYVNRVFTTYKNGEPCTIEAIHPVTNTMIGIKL